MKFFASRKSKKEVSLSGIETVEEVPEVVEDLNDVEEKLLESEYEVYLKEAEKINEAIREKTRDYNDMTPLINVHRRFVFKPQMKKLDDFLVSLGKKPRELNPFAYVNEKSQLDLRQEVLVDEARLQGGIPLGAENDRLLKKAMPWVGIMAVGMAPIAIPAMVGYAQFNALKLLWNGKKAEEEAQARLLEFKLQCEQDLQARRSMLKTMENACELAHLYLYTMEIIGEAFEEVFYPQFGRIQAFLLAEDVRIQRSQGVPITKIAFQPIGKYKENEHSSYYAFVHDTNDLYHLILDVYLHPVLTELLQGIEVQEGDQLKHKFQEIQKMCHDFTNLEKAEGSEAKG